MSAKVSDAAEIKSNASDANKYPVSRIEDPVNFTLAGAVVLNPHLLEKIHSHGVAEETNQRWEWKLECPLCKIFIGNWICALPGVRLSKNQQQTNRNTRLRGKSHYSRMHEAKIHAAYIEASKPPTDVAFHCTMLVCK